MKTYLIILLLLVAPGKNGVAQDSFVIENGKEYFKLKFDLINNLIIIPVEINGLKLSFLLDTGVDTTVLFSLEGKDSLDLRNASFIYLRGLGADKPIRAIKSEGNDIKIGGSVNKNLNIYMILDTGMGISSRMGKAIHGIIGYDFFKDFVVETNYRRKKMKVYNPDLYKAGKCRRCENFKISLYKNKPYINTQIRINDSLVDSNLLIDSGSGDALWLFREEKEGIQIPEVYFEDFLGYGLTGSVHGLRSRIEILKLGRFEFEKVTTSFPDTIHFKNIETFEDREGSLGAEILRRFHSTINYRENWLRLKPNANFKEAFEYDMSGVKVAHDGFTLVKEPLVDDLTQKNTKKSVSEGLLIYKSSKKVRFKLEPEYKVVEIRPDSPAEKAGLKKGDILVGINNRPAYKYKLSQIYNLLSSEEGKLIKFKVRRGNTKKTIRFQLERDL